MEPLSNQANTIDAIARALVRPIVTVGERVLLTV